MASTATRRTATDGTDDYSTGTGWLRGQRLRQALVAGLSALLGLAALSPAQIPRSPWQQLPHSAGGIGNEAGLLRLHDGSLEVAYVSNAPHGKQTLATALISPAGKVTPEAPIVKNWLGLNNPALISDTGGYTTVQCPNDPKCPLGYRLVPEKGGIRAFWGGIIADHEPEASLETATASTPSSGWNYQFGGVNVAQCILHNPCKPPGDLGKLYSFSAKDTAAVAIPKGQPAEAWSSGLGAYVHIGTAPGDARNDEPGSDQGVDDDTEQTSGDFQTPYPGGAMGCCAYNANLALDGATGKPFMAWFSTGRRRGPSSQGIYVQEAFPNTGYPVGTSLKVPGSSIFNLPRGNRVPLTGRPGKPDVYVAFAKGSLSQTLVVQRVLGPNTKTPAPIVVTSGTGAVRNIAITSDTQGRIWVAWTIAGRLYASRSNSSTRHFDKPVWIRTPAVSEQLDISAWGDKLDAIGTFGCDCGSQHAAIWHAQLHAAAH